MNHFSFGLVEDSPKSFTSEKHDRIALKFGMKDKHPLCMYDGDNTPDYLQLVESITSTVVFLPRGYKVGAVLESSVTVSGGEQFVVKTVMDITASDAQRILERFFFEGAQGLDDDTAFMLETIFRAWVISGCPMEDHLTGVKYRMR
jgi:hypothetical protein